MAENVTWPLKCLPLGGYGWQAIGVAAAMSERHPEQEHPLRGPEEPPPAAPQEPVKEPDKEEEEKSA